METENKQGTEYGSRDPRGDNGSFPNNKFTKCSRSQENNSAAYVHIIEVSARQHQSIKKNIHPNGEFDIHLKQRHHFFRAHKAQHLRLHLALDV